MIAISVKRLALLLKGELCYVKQLDTLLSKVSTNSEKIEQGSLFFALKGTRFDGHDFAVTAVEKGAMLVVVSHKLIEKIPQLVVGNVESALGQLAHWVRTKVNTQVIALTGSSGKTSVKEITAAILRQCGKTLYTEGNYNNEIGVPLTLLRLNAHYRYAVVEMGANHPHEIAYTSQLTRPCSVLINNIALAHLEGFGSLAGVAKAKGEIFLGLPQRGGKVFLNYDSYSVDWLAHLSTQSVYFFSLQSKKADYYASDIAASAGKTTFVIHTPKSKFTVNSPLIGQHNVSNVVAATALALSVGASEEAVVKGILTVRPVKGRLYPIRIKATQQIIDDTYNANMASMRAAIDVLTTQAGYRVLVVGDMKELGQSAVVCHKEIGQLVQSSQIDCVLSVGDLSQFISTAHRQGKHYPNKEELVIELKQLIIAQPALTILVKGSRSMAMEQIIEKLLK